MIVSGLAIEPVKALARKRRLASRPAAQAFAQRAIAGAGTIARNQPRAPTVRAARVV
jgi:hypothetical protein